MLNFSRVKTRVSKEQLHILAHKRWFLKDAVFESKGR